MAAFLGIMIIMGVDPKGELNDYWSTNTALRNEKIAGVMSRNRFQKILQYFHVNDARNDPANKSNPAERATERRHRPMYKVAPILKTVIHQSQQMYNLHCEVAIDEAIIGYKGRYNGIPTVFIQGKPRAKGFKVYVLADSHSNYVANLKFMTSTGSHEEDMRNVSKTAALCENLIQPFTGLHHVLYTDSYYTSIEMASRLLDYHHTYVVGSMRQDRRGFPNALRTNPRRNPASNQTFHSLIAGNNVEPITCII
uniref:PiggyBac transposable element-derived protein 5-like n=1 Tax=Saccoglossus kowalevskii TaxID=10224 RepID=A0ABM0M5P3_SACKO|nr:PREDICTED: piggyBac transposable element-derived protein 5-like [Saccoglossus kowalevskii]